MPDTLPPTPMPGSKPSAPDRGDPRAATDKATHAEQSAANQPTPAQRATQIKEHATALEQVFGKPERGVVDADRGGKNQTVSDVIDAAVAGTKSNPDPEYQ